MASRRRILPPETLAAFGAAALYPPSPTVGDVNGGDPVARGHGQRLQRTQPPTPMTCAVSMSTSSPRPRRAGSPSSSTKSEEIQPYGMNIGGWKITTRNSTIGDEKGMDNLTLLLEETANNDNGNDLDDKIITDTDTEAEGSSSSSSRICSGKRRLCPPEITFLDAIISFQYHSESTIPDNLVEKSGEKGMMMTEIRFTARDALLEWAEAHRTLEMDRDHTHTATASNSPTSSSKDECRGVSILRTVDAKIWSNKARTNINAAAGTGTGTGTGTVAKSTTNNSEFYYDWTFSSPYASTVRQSQQLENPSEETGKHHDDYGDININNRRQWQPLQRSHIPFHLLQDTSQPILLFDDIHLYEDDLHDNGDVSLNVKIRVMPRCWYVLQRLYVRVDHVCVRCREVRYFCLLDNHHGSNGSDVRANTVYRDVVWREATWDQLGGLALPEDPAAWREESAGVTASGIPGAPPLASLLMKLPTVPLPGDLPRFSYFDAAGKE